MAQKREFGEGPIYTIFNYLWWFCLGNFYFLLCSIPLILTIIAFNSSLLTDGLIFLSISMVFEGPAATALCSVMGKLEREKDVDITKDYFKAYKLNFVQSIMFSTIQSLLIFILITDIKFFKLSPKGSLFIPFFIIMLLIILLVNSFIFPIISRFYLKSKDVLKLSIYYCFTKFKVTLYNLSIIVIALFSMQYIPVISIFFISSLMSFFIMSSEKDVLKLIEENIKIES